MYVHAHTQTHVKIYIRHFLHFLFSLAYDRCERLKHGQRTHTETDKSTGMGEIRQVCLK